jgi:hypothetical protein
MIQRWLRSNPALTESSQEAQLLYVRSLDDQMIEAFSFREDRLMESLMAQRVWGTEEGLREFNTRRLELWSEVVAETLPSSNS